MGKNKIGNLAKVMSQRAGIDGRHTNHSARRTAVARLSESGFEDTDIIQVTGHKNCEGLKPYKVMNYTKQKKISNCLTSYIGADAIGEEQVEISSSQEVEEVTEETYQLEPNCGKDEDSFEVFSGRGQGNKPIFKNCVFNNVNFTF